MKRIGLAGMATIGLLVCGTSDRVQAQFGPYNPPISPYINIIRGGASPAVNYFNIVQPQLDFNNAIGSLQGQQNAMGQGGGANSVGSTTGHPIAYGNYMQFYNPRGALAYYSGGMGGMGGGMGGMGGMGGGMGGMGGGMGGMGGGMGGMGGGMGGMGGGMGMGGMGGGMGMGGMGGMNMGGMGR